MRISWNRRPGVVTAVLALGLVASPLLAQSPDDPVLPLASALARVDSVFAMYDRTDSPGCAIGIMRAGDLRYARGYGMANLELGRAIGLASVFRIGSTSKQFTAAAIVLAEQEGYLSLDDDIRRHLPEIPEYERPITIRMLLHHTSGIRDYITLTGLTGLRDDDWYSIDEAYRIIARQSATNFPPGDEHLYSNSGYFLLSQIIERATGSSLRAFAEEHLFRPLGMRHTHFHDDHNHIVPGRADGYAPRGDGFRTSMTTLDMVGDGGVFTTIEDLARWDANFYEPTVGGPAFLDAMLTRGVLTSGDTLDYALGLFHGEYRGVPRVSHGGAFVGFRAEMMRFPEQRLTIALLCNVSTARTTAMVEQVADVLLENVLEPDGRTAAGEGGPADGPGDAAPAAGAGAPAPMELSVEQLERWAGLYRVADGPDYLRFEMRDGRLTAVGPGLTLRPVGEMRFEFEGEPASIEFRAEAGGRRFTIRQPSGPIEGLAVEPAVITPESAAAYAGRYHATELDVDYVITAEGTTLRVARGRRGPVTLTPTIPDEFRARQVATMRFEWSGGRPTAFVVDAGRVRGIRFERVGD